MTFIAGNDGKHACPYEPCERRVSMHLFAWDDDSIDNAAAEPDRSAPVTRLTAKLPPVDELHWLLDAGESIAAIASRFGVSEDGVLAARRRAAAV